MKNTVPLTQVLDCGHIAGAVLRDALRMLAAGLALGIPLSLAATRWIASFLYGLRPGDPLTYCAVVALLCAASLAAAFVPSRRAARVDPMVALRLKSDPQTFRAAADMSSGGIRDGNVTDR
ncbi:MAG: hypothetical protein ABSG03_34255 [Bryobacteraceae bacterium]